MSESFEFREPSHFVAGAVGPPGQRTFYIQAGQNGELVSLKLEKQQVVALAQFLRSALEDLPSPTSELPMEPLMEPVDERWVVGQIAVGVDEADGEIVLIVEELSPFDESLDEDDDEDAPPDFLDDVSDGASLRVHIGVEQASAFVAQSDGLVAKSRPPCRLCGQPDDAGHACPRLN